MSFGLYQLLYHFSHYLNHPISVNYTSIRQIDKGENIMCFNSFPVYGKREDYRNQGVEPYFWPAMMQPEQREGIIKVSTPSSERARVVTTDSQPGGTGGDPTQPGVPPEFPTETRQYWFM